MTGFEALPVRAPWSGPEIAGELLRVGAACDAFWNAIPTEEFFAPLGTAWSPADNVRHLVRSMRPVSLALRLPRVALAVLFGRARRPSRSYDVVRQDYRGVLARGGQAGRFAPPPQVVRGDREVYRRRLMSARVETEEALAERIGSWRESDLDSCRLPHPLLGRLTVREMLLFTLYHGVHHVGNVSRRRSGD